MTRSHRPALARLLAVSAGALILAVVGAAPAHADYAPDGTASISVGSQFYEGGSAGFTGLCPLGTTDVFVSSVPSVGVVITPDPIVFPTDEGFFSGGWQTTNDFADPGAEIEFTVTCIGDALLVTGSETITSFDSGAFIDAPETVVYPGDVVVTGNCGDERAGYVAFRVTLPNGDELYFDGMAVGEDGAWSASFPSNLLGAGSEPAGPGDLLTLTADCRDAVDTQAWYSHRTATVLIVAAGTSPDAPTALPPTGATTTPLLVGGVGALGLLAAGLLLRRRVAR